MIVGRNSPLKCNDFPKNSKVIFRSPSDETNLDEGLCGVTYLILVNFDHDDFICRYFMMIFRSVSFDHDDAFTKNKYLSPSLESGASKDLQFGIHYG